MSSTNGLLNTAQRFLAIRVNQGVSQQKFADALGISLRAEQNYERGIRAIPSELLLALAKVYKVDPLWILDGDTDQPRFINNSTVLDSGLLERAVTVVLKTVAQSRKDVNPNKISTWIIAVYQFYEKNPSGSGVESLVDVLAGDRSA